MRILITKRGCKKCRVSIKLAHWINLKLPFDKRIIIIDNYQYESMGLKLFPIVDRFDYDDYPYWNLDGVEIVGGNKEVLKPLLKSFFESEFITNVYTTNV